MTTKYTAEVVKQHNTAKDCWLIYKNKVLDVTKFLDEHPGGEEVLLDAAGRDATKDIDDVGHSQEAHKSMESMVIGEVEGGAATEPTKKEAVAPKKKAPESSTPVWLFPLLLMLIAVVLYFFYAQ